MHFVSLLREHPRLMGFGLLFCFGSSAGQTFFISLFVPSLAQAHGLSEPAIANVYGLVTLASAAALVVVGRLIDRMDVLTYATGACLVLALGCSLLAGAWGLASLVAGLGLVRLGGQGLLSHVALTGVARHFDARRGAALALVTLGHPLGEILLPAATAWAIGEVGWRVTYAVAGSFVIVFILPIGAWLLRGATAFRRPQGGGGGDPPSSDATARRVGAMRARDLWRSRGFLAVAPAYCAAPFAVTALVFHQARLAEDKGLTLGLFAASFALFGVMQVVSGIASGPAIDRFGAGPLFAWHLIPFGLGVGVLALTDSAWAAPVYLGLLGASAGAGGTLRTALVAELVRPGELGAARSGLTALMVFSTALGPAAYGWLMLAGIGADGLLWATLVLVALASVLAAAGQRWLRSTDE